MQFPNLNIVGFSRGPKILEITDPPKQNESGLDINVEENKKTIETINQAHPTILFVAFGMGKQEKWIFENLKKMPSVKIAMGIGGAFDYISEKVKRAPLLARKLGLEWLYRLIKEPKRIVRIWNATVGFLLLTYLHKK